jgi:hypothetical protein
MAKAEAGRVEITADVLRLRPGAETAAETERIGTATEVESVRQCKQIGQILGGSPALRLRCAEPQHSRRCAELAQSGNARIYTGFPKHARADADGVHQHVSRLLPAFSAIPAAHQEWTRRAPA